MKKVIAAALAASMFSATAALAHGGPAKQEHRQPMVSYILTGVATSDATATSVAVQLTRGNGHVKKAMRLGSAGEITVTLGPSTRFVKRDFDGAATYMQVKKGDKLHIHVRAPKGTGLMNLPAAKWVIDKTPYVETAPAPPPVPAPVPVPEPLPLPVPPPVVMPTGI
jgi:hypothetical protein